jgi:hypothetical protein
LIAKKPFDMGVKAHFNDYGLTPGFPHIERSFIWLRIIMSSAPNAAAQHGNSESTLLLNHNDTAAKISYAAVISLLRTDLQDPKSIHHSPVQSAGQI